MAKKKKENAKFGNNEAPISPLFSNIVAVFSSENVILVDFGFYAPSYYEPHDIKDALCARICLTWQSAEGLLDLLQEAISEHKERKKPKRKVKSKDKRG